MADPVIPEWDNNSTHLIDPVAGHKNDGYGTNEVPASDELNGLFRLLARNVALLRQRRDVADLNAQLLPAVDASVVFNSKHSIELSRPAYTSLLYPRAIAPAPASAFPRQGTANNKLQIAPGTLYQYNGTDLLAYRFAGTEEVTIANGDVSNPRIDIVQMKITANANTLATTVDINVKQGTPAASPAYPTPDAGYVLLFGVLVGTNYVAAAGFKFHDTAGAVAVIHDQRMPIRVRPYRVDAKNFEFDPVAWGLASTSGEYLEKISASGTQNMKIRGPAGLTGRIIGVELGSKAGSGAACTLVRYNYTNSGLNALSLNNVNGLIDTSGTYRNYILPIGDVEVTHLPAAGPTTSATAWTFTGSEEAILNPPIWTSGARTPYQKWDSGVEATPNSFDCVGLLISSAPTGLRITHATFYVAEGL